MDGYFDFKPEFLVMENGSNILKLPHHERIRYQQRDERGLGWALKEGIRSASFQQVFFLPADLSYDLAFVRHAQAYLETGYSMVIGSKALQDSEVNRPFKRQLVSSCYNFSLKLRYGAYWPSDITGAKGYLKYDILPLLKEAPADDIWFEVQLMKALRKYRFKCKEVAVKVNDHRPSPFNLLGSGR